MSPDSLLGPALGELEDEWSLSLADKVLSSGFINSLALSSPLLSFPFVTFSSSSISSSCASSSYSLFSLKCVLFKVNPSSS